MSIKDIKCGICKGSGKVRKVYYTVYPGEPMEMIDTGEMKDCPGCDGEGVSIKAKMEMGMKV